jgi:hypothetical protein
MVIEKSEKQVSRRRFLTRAAAVAPGLATANVLSPLQHASAAAIPKKWDREIDVVVIGSGFVVIRD